MSTTPIAMTKATRTGLKIPRIVACYMDVRVQHRAIATVRHRTLLVSSSTGSHESANVDVHTWQVDSGRARSSLGARSAPARYRTCRLSRHFTSDNSMRLEARLYVMLGSHRPTARRPHDIYRCIVEGARAFTARARRRQHHARRLCALEIRIYTAAVKL